MSATPAIIKRLPKADLHSHIDGSVPLKELFAIASARRRPLLTREGAELSTAGALADHVRGRGYGSLLEEIVDRFYPIVGLMQTEEVLRDVGIAYVRELKRHNIVYAEGRFAPQYHVREGLSFAQAIASISEGLEEGSEEYGVRTNLIVAVGRESNPDVGIEVAREAANSGKAVALDLTGSEATNPPEKFRNAFEVATVAGLKKTVHAGESAGSVDLNLLNIRAAIEVLGAHRIGHSIDTVKDPELVSLTSERGIALEMNPISNLVLGKIRDIRDLGIDRLLDSGVPVTVNSDDPALWPGGSIDDVLSKVCSSYGFGVGQLDRLVVNSFRCSFANQKEKDMMVEEYSRRREG